MAASINEKGVSLPRLESIMYFIPEARQGQMESLVMFKYWMWHAKSVTLTYSLQNTGPYGMTYMFVYWRHKNENHLILIIPACAHEIVTDSLYTNHYTACIWFLLLKQWHSLPTLWSWFIYTHLSLNKPCCAMWFHTFVRKILSSPAKQK